MVGSELDERTSLILRTVVVKYVETARPVGSETITYAADLGVSGATVRNVMGALERHGYLVQPHISAGRIPTDQGYRYFVDQVENTDLASKQKRVVNDFFDAPPQELEALLEKTSKLLARVADHAAVVVLPKPETAKICSIQVVGLEPGIALALVVLSNGIVEKETFTLDQGVTIQTLESVSKLLHDALLGKTLGEVVSLTHEDPLVHSLSKTVHAALTDRANQVSGRLFIGGASRIMAESNAFEVPETAPTLFGFLENEGNVISVVQGSGKDGVTVCIGHENSATELQGCSVILAPYHIEEYMGTIGIIGPTRMDYQRSLAAVNLISRQLTMALS